MIRTTLSRALLQPVRLTTPKYVVPLFTRLQSTQNTPHESALASDIHGDEAEAWLSSVRELRARFQNEGVPQYEDSALERLAKSEFEPTPEQVAKLESLEGIPIPQKHDPVVQHCTNMIMKHGKKATAEKTMARALYIVRLQLRKDPIEVLKETLDKMGPLMQLKTYKTKIAKNLVVPQPLSARQRNRRAWQWIVEGSDKRKSREFSVRLGEEIVAAYGGKSSGYEKKTMMHKQAMLHRSYIKLR